tara:strand:- start:1269 stop:2399 length:1131 start_codon:yes stop_codon:yes gene_type:complete
MQIINNLTLLLVCFIRLQYIRPRSEFIKLEQNFKNPLVSIIILNYNAGKLLEDCIDSISQSNYEKYEIILVDNNSNDNSHLECKQKFQSINLIENKKNLGYCEGNNVGIRASNGEFVIILNPDTIVDPNWINELLVGYKKFGDGIYQPKFLTIDDKSIIQSTGNMIQIFGFGYSRSKGEKDQNHFNEIEIVDYASGTCLFTSKKILDKLDLLDSFLFAYHDDLDLCWRARMQGIHSYYVPNSIVFHPSEGFSFKWSNFKFFLLERNRLYCIFTHYSRKTILKFLPSLILIDIAVSFFYLKNGLLTEKIKASLNILKNLRKINSRYGEIQSKRTIDDKKIIIDFKNEVILPKGTNLKNKVPFNPILKFLSKLCRLVI